MTNKAAGTFTVKIVPQTERTIALLSRMTIDKEIHGDLEASTQGQMLAAGTAIPNSAGYVAIERVEGTLHGKKGSFVLQHNATMNRGVPSLNITVVPDSGTDELTGLSGIFTVIIEEGKHSYEFVYTLSDSN
jgi:Protein of unknown function (DUF3224)